MVIDMWLLFAYCDFVNGFMIVLDFLIQRVLLFICASVIESPINDFNHNNVTYKWLLYNKAAQDKKIYFVSGSNFEIDEAFSNIWISDPNLCNKLKWKRRMEIPLVETFAVEYFQSRDSVMYDLIKNLVASTFSQVSPADLFHDGTEFIATRESQHPP